MQSVKFHLKDVNPFNTILVGVWDSRKINYSKSNECVCVCSVPHWKSPAGPKGEEELKDGQTN